MITAADLSHAVTRFDRAQQNRRNYNIYALGMYLQRVDDTITAINDGRDPKDVLSRSYNGALLAYLLKHFKL